MHKVREGYESAMRYESGVPLESKSPFDSNETEAQPMSKVTKFNVTHVSKETYIRKSLPAHRVSCSTS